MLHLNDVVCGLLACKCSLFACEFVGSDPVSQDTRHVIGTSLRAPHQPKKKDENKKEHLEINALHNHNIGTSNHGNA